MSKSGLCPAAEKKRRAMMDWLKEWGSFWDDEEMASYPFCMVDVLAIMSDYRSYRKRTQPTAKRKRRAESGGER